MTKLTSYDDASVGMGSVVNEVLFGYGKLDTVTAVYQEWRGAVTTGSGGSPKVEHAFSYPSDGTTAVRRISTTYPSDKAVTEIYPPGTDHALSRLTGRDYNGSRLFTEIYQGLGRLVERRYGNLDIYWSLVELAGGLDRFHRPGHLRVRDRENGTTLNEYVYSYDFASRVTFRENPAGSCAGSGAFHESFGFDRPGGPIDHTREDPSDAVGRECWTLDRSGNTLTSAGSLTTLCPANQASYTYNLSGEMVTRDGVTGWATYNDPGDLTHKGYPAEGQSYLYDAWHRLVRVQDEELGQDLGV